MVLVAGKSKIKVPADQMYGENLLPGLQMAVFLCPHVVETGERAQHGLFYKDTNVIHEGLPPWPNYFPKTPPHYPVILSHWGFDFNIQIWRNTTIPSITPLDIIYLLTHCLFPLSTVSTTWKQGHYLIPYYQQLKQSWAPNWQSLKICCITDAGGWMDFDYINLNHLASLPHFTSFPDADGRCYTTYLIWNTKDMVKKWEGWTLYHLLWEKYWSIWARSHLKVAMTG